jgi:hypothetical protein
LVKIIWVDTSECRRVVGFGKRRGRDGVDGVWRPEDKTRRQNQINMYLYTEVSIMTTTLQSTARGIEVNAQILSRLGKLNEMHSAKKVDCFAKDLPFYTCIDSAKDLWTKELSNGQLFLVKRDFDFDKDVPVDSFIRDLR